MKGLIATITKLRNKTKPEERRDASDTLVLGKIAEAIDCFAEGSDSRQWVFDLYPKIRRANLDSLPEGECNLCCPTMALFVGAYIYLARARSICPILPWTPADLYNLFLGSILVSSKVLDDYNIWNVTLAKGMKMSIGSIKLAETRLLTLLRFNVCFTPEDCKSMHEIASGVYVDAE